MKARSNAHKPRHRRGTEGAALEPMLEHPLFPACNGRLVSPWDRPGPHHELKMAFLQACHRLNLLRSRWLEEGSGRERSRVGIALRRLLAEAAGATELLAKSALAQGVVAVPIHHCGFIIDVRFDYPGRTKPAQVEVTARARRVLTFRVPGCGGPLK